jgi:hypothetical protein
MVNGVEASVGEAVGTTLEVGISVSGVALPVFAQEVSRIKVAIRKTCLLYTRMSPGKGCRYFT